jgi:hypothetical protein
MLTADTGPDPNAAAAFSHLRPVRRHAARSITGMHAMTKTVHFSQAKNAT